MFNGDHGILNDFDLASTMKAGDAMASPPKTHTGTAMFMSLDLPTVSMGALPGLSHELESFAWVLLYAALCVTNGKENLNVPPFRNGVALTSIDLGLQKSAFLSYAPENIINWVKAPYQRLALLLTVICTKANQISVADSFFPFRQGFAHPGFRRVGVPTAEWVDFKDHFFPQLPVLLLIQTSST
jgi:hypothetical protein